MAKAMLIDITKCLGCNACTQACKMANNVPKEVFRTQVHQQESGTFPNVTMVFAKSSCKHCLSPGCASACPVGSLQKTIEGPVVYDADKCIGCRYCMNACPFNVPTFDWNKGLLDAPVINKCTFCLDRVDGGEGPACAEACPFGAVTFGERNELLAEAHARIEKRSDLYINHVYGESEVGGTSLLYLSNVPFEELGLPAYGPESVTTASEEVMKGTIPFAVGWGVLLAGAYGVVRWRERGMAKTQASKAVQQEKED